MIIHEITIKELQKNIENVLDLYDVSSEISQDVYYVFDNKMTACKGVLMDHRAYPNGIDFENVSYATKIDKKGNLIIPKTLCDKMGWVEGTELDITEENGKIVIKKV